MTNGPLAIRHERIGAVDVLHLTGEIDIGNAERVQQALEATTAPDVVLETTGVQYVDSAGIRVIDVGYRQLDEQRRVMAVVSPPGSTARWTFQVAGFRGGVLYDDLDAALAAAVERTSEEGRAVS